MDRVNTSKTNTENIFVDDMTVIIIDNQVQYVYLFIY